MSRSETVRVDAARKADAEAVLDQLGRSASEAVRLFYTQAALRKGLPFDAVIPNAATRAALADADQGKGLTRYGDVGALFGDLGGSPPRRRVAGLVL